MEIGETPQSNEKKYLSPEAIGPKIIGNQNPNKLTPEQFKNSPEILFHGTPIKFKFSPEFNYEADHYLEINDGSQTLGEGFYTTPNLKSAQEYSTIRQKDKTTPVVIEVLPFQAKMLDLRDKHQPTKNAPIPSHLFSKWCETVKQNYQAVLSKDTPWYIREMEEKYLLYLEKLSSISSSPDLRVMLGTTPSPHPELSTLNFPSPPWMKLFSKFMIEQNYDGLIYNEGSEKKNGQINPSYVFYNLEKINTFENWQNKKTPLYKQRSSS